jgi:hypothetical protein
MEATQERSHWPDDGPFTASAMGDIRPLSKLMFVLPISFFNPGTGILEAHLLEVPYQDNCWDCGVSVCRYAFALSMLRDKVIKFGDSDTKREALNDAISNRKRSFQV